MKTTYYGSLLFAHLDMHAYSCHHPISLPTKTNTPGKMTIPVTYCPQEIQEGQQGPNSLIWVIVSSTF